MGFLFEYTSGKVTWKIKHHPIEKENHLKTKKQTPFLGVQDMIFSGGKASLQFRAVRFSVGSHLDRLELVGRHFESPWVFEVTETPFENDVVVANHLGDLGVKTP